MRNKSAKPKMSLTTTSAFSKTKRRWSQDIMIWKKFTSGAKHSLKH